ncbi:MAG: nitroreductase family protein [Brevinema sp.]
MNQFIHTMHNRYSVRKFNSSKQIPTDILNQILNAGRQAPNYINGQQYSIILIDDESKKERLVELTMPSSGHPMSFIKKAPIFLLFVMDFHKINEMMKLQNTEMHVQDTLESLMIGTVDIGIAAEAISAAAESLGLGTVMVGAVRRSTEEVIKLFNLPKYTFPILGLSLGYPSDDISTEINPRLPLETLVHKNTYHLADFKTIVTDYNKITETRFSSRGMEGTDWSKFVSGFFNKPVFPNISSVYQSQGFKLN